MYNCKEFICIKFHNIYSFIENQDINCQLHYNLQFHHQLIHQVMILIHNNTTNVIAAHIASRWINIIIQ
uniref:Uncharacterized protein n=1 Tax=Octopus bimaculoides TaxID=37653 RepID=A0A0L8HTU8_OCTBM